MAGGVFGEWGCWMADVSNGSGVLSVVFGGTSRDEVCFSGKK